MSKSIAVLVCCALVAALTACVSGADATDPGEVTELPVLEISRFDEDDAGLAATFLGSNATERESTPGDTFTSFESGDSSLMIDDDGVISFSGPEPHENVSVEWSDARTIATGFVEDTLGMPDDAVGPEPSKDPTVDPGATTYAFSFRWERQIDGVPVAGAQWIDALVGGDGQVMSLLWRWHQVTGEGEMVQISEPEDVIDPSGELIGGSCPDCSPKPTAEDVAGARLVYHVPFTGPATEMTPAWEVTAGEGDAAVEYYFHAQTGEPLDW